MIDTIDFNFRVEAKGRDPDAYSPSLKKCHQLLWSKPLPRGKVFKLDGNLRHSSELGDFSLSGDSIISTFITYKRTEHIIKQLSDEEKDYFWHLADTIGGFIVFPSNRVYNQTINMARGFRKEISDRFDLTLECIRRYYLNEQSPLYDVIFGYRSFFELFDDFKGYVDFFLLQNLVFPDYSSIKFFLPFNDFTSSPIPQTLEDYLVYRNNTIQFIKDRNNMIRKILNI
jgi:hypothetical protein